MPIFRLINISKIELINVNISRLFAPALLVNGPSELSESSQYWPLGRMSIGCAFAGLAY